MAVASFGLVPIVEELWARGYFVRRLRDGFDTGGAIVVSSLFFAFAHTQYFKLEVVSLGLLAGLVITSLAAAGTLVRTGSLVPCVLAHALVNVPPPPSSLTRPAIVTLIALVLFANRRQVAEWAVWIVRQIRERTPWRLTGLGVLALAAVLATMLVSRAAVIAAGVGMLVASIVLTSVDARGAGDG